MDVVYYRPSCSQLSRHWNDFKKGKYKLFRKIFYYTTSSPEPAPCSFDIDDYVFDPFFKHSQANELHCTD